MGLILEILGVWVLLGAAVALLLGRFIKVGSGGL